MPKPLPPNAKAFRPVAEGLARAEILTRSKTAPVDQSLVRAVLSESVPRERVEESPPRLPISSPREDTVPPAVPESNLLSLPTRDERSAPRARERPIAASPER